MARSINLPLTAIHVHQNKNAHGITAKGNAAILHCTNAVHQWRAFSLRLRLNGI
jgi:hypothetical protein